VEPDQAPAYGPWHGAADPGKAQGQGYPAQGYPAQGYPGQLAGGGPDKRPGTVTAACAITWIGSVLVALLVALIALVLLSDPDSFVREVQREADVANVQVTRAQALSVTWTIVGVTLVWCLLAIVLAVLAFRRSRGGRIGLAVSAALTVLVSLLAILSVVAALPLLLGVAVLVLLFTGGANDWFARRGGWPTPPSAGGSYPGQVGGQPGQAYGQPPAPPYGQQPPPPGRSGPW
jgi:hypothetical protein